MDYENLNESLNLSVMGRSKDIIVNFMKSLHKPRDIKSVVSPEYFDIKISRFTSGEVLVDDSVITIKGISMKTLLTRIRRLYKEKNLEYIFTKEYSSRSRELYNKQKIDKASMDIRELKFNEFFALEVIKIFKDLYDKYGYRFYLKIMTDIYNNTWVKDLDSQRKSDKKLKMTKLKNIKYRLNPYQREFIENYEDYKSRLNLEGYILAFDQGLGKTLTSVALSEVIDNQVTFIVVPNAVKYQWAEEIKDYYGMTNEQWKKEVYVCSDTNYKYNLKTTKFIITNIETIPRMYQYAHNYDKSTLIVDEIHNFRNINGKRTRDLIKLKDTLRTKDSILLSGTPVKAIPSEITPALRLIDPMFNDEVAHTFNRSFNSRKEVVTQIVAERFGMTMHVKKKSEELNLPKRHEDIVNLKISNPQPYTLSHISDEINKEFNKLYKDKLKETSRLIADYRILIQKYSKSSIEDRDMYLKWISNDMLSQQMHTLTKEFLSTYPDKHVIPNIDDRDEFVKFDKIKKELLTMKRHAMASAIGKVLPPARNEMFIKMFDENIEDILKIINESDKKILIFSTFKPVVEHINARLNEIKQGISVMIHGDIKANREVILQEFKERDDSQVLVATSQTMGTGVNLIEANTMIFFGTPWRSADLEQAKDRIYRIGQQSEVYVHTMSLDSGRLPNLSTRMTDILKWSDIMYNSLVVPENQKESERMEKVIMEDTEMEVINEAVTMTPSKRKKMENVIIQTLLMLDKDGSNAKKYRDMFKEMDDTKFNNYFRKFLNDDDSNFYIEFIPYKNEPHMKDIRAAADYLKVPLEEYVYYRHNGNMEDPLRTQDEVMVGYVHLKRLRAKRSPGNVINLTITGGTGDIAV